MSEAPKSEASPPIIIGEVGGDGDFFWGKIMKCGKDLVYLQPKAY